MKMISIDDLIEYCDSERTAYRANNSGAACTALRRVTEFVKEYAVEAEPVKHGRWIDNQPTVEAITREQYHDMTERFFDEFVDNGANESGDSNA